MSENKVTKLELTGEEAAYITYCIGFAYIHLSAYQRDIVKKILDKIAKV